MAGAVSFSEKANEHIAAAQQLALDAGHQQCEPVHLLSVLLADDSVAGALRRSGQDITQVKQRVQRQLPRPIPSFGAGGFQGLDGVIQASPALKAVLDGAGELAFATRAARVDELILVQAYGRSEHPGVRQLVEAVGLLAVAPYALPAAAGSPASFHDPELFHALGRFGRVLTAEAAAGQLDPVVGRVQELERVMHILGRRRKNNPVLIGPPGVGKTAIVEGLAQAIAQGTVPSAVAGKHIFALDVGSLVAGTKYRGEFEERVQLLLGSIAGADGNIILFIDELHTIARAGGAEGAIDAASFFKPLLARGELRAIGATTVDEYQLHIARDGALERRFQPVRVAEPTPDEALDMLAGLRSTYQRYHGVLISDEALQAAVAVSPSRLPGRHLPDRAIDLIDEAASRKRAENDQQDESTQAPTPSVGPDDIRRVVDDWVGPTGRRGGFARWRSGPKSTRAERP
jgi:ATP-dependent Clp protease ATP-binding subunit ClpB